MKKIVIDTNILYYWLGLSHHHQLTPTKINNIINENEIYITTPSIIEAIVKYRDSVESIRKCLEPIVSRKLNILNIGLLSVSNDEIRTISMANSVTEIETILKELLLRKIQTESNFLHFIFTSMIFGFFNSLLRDEEYKFKNPEKMSELLSVTETIITANQSLCLGIIQNDLINGYNNNNAQKAIKKSFSDLFLTYYNAWRIYYYKVKNSITLKNLNQKKNGQDNFESELSKDKIYRKIISKYMDNPLKLLSKEKYHKEILDFLNGYQSEFKAREILPEEVLAYIMTKLERYFINSAKIEKNDIIDLLFLFVFDFDDYIFFTGDGPLIGVLETINHRSHEFITTVINQEK